MVDVQRSAFARPPALYHAVPVDASSASSDSDSDDFYEPAHASPTTSTSSMDRSPYSFSTAAMQASILEGAPAADDDDSLFAAYAVDTQTQELELPMRPNTWDFCGAPNAPPLGLPVQASTPSTAATSPASSKASSPSPADCASPRLNMTARQPGNKQGIKRPLERATAAPSAIPTVSIASSMLALNQGAPPMRRPTTSAAAASAGRRSRKDSMSELKPSLHPAAGKKTKVSRERQLKINAASRRCRKKQKLELQFLRTHVVELQLAIKEQIGVLVAMPPHQQRVAKLATFLEQSARKVEEMSAGGRPSSTAKPTLLSESELEELRVVAAKALSQSQAHTELAPITAATMPAMSTSTCSSPTWSSCKSELGAASPTGAMSEYALTPERKATLLNIAAFVRNNMALESQSFSPEVISCLPIEMDGWQLRLAITEKNYTIHNCKFFPCAVRDMYDFCWETNVASKTSIKQGKNEFCVVTPLATDVAYVDSKTIGKWSLLVHGVPNVSYNSLLCRMHDAEGGQGRAIICQQSVLEDRDFQDESTIPWLFKRWVVFQPRVVNGVAGTFVEAYRTASYATGRLIYKENNTYDSFCEHLIRRYAESNSLLERMMARDPRFQHVAAIDPNHATAAAIDLDLEETTSDRIVKDLLLF